MPRARNIKPALFKNELLGEADPMLTLLFIGLWTLADREGRLEDRPKRIWAELFPYRDCRDINGYLTELARLEFICRYSVGNLDVIQIVNFSKHQHPHKTEKASELPENPQETDTCDSTVRAPLSNGSSTVRARLIPDSSNTDIPPQSDGSDYAFQGDTIRVSPDDFRKLSDKYPNLDIAYQLGQLDLELRGKKNWWVELNSKLNYRNKTPAHHASSGQREASLL